jgi:hypothetical protein
MPPRPPEREREPEPEGDGVPERATLDPADQGDWDEERMRQALPREIRLNPDGSRHSEP